jgi:hypothetical protein
MSLMVLQPLKAASVAASAQELESRFIIGTRPSGRQNQSVVLHPQHCFCRTDDDAAIGEVSLPLTLILFRP